MNFTVLAVGPFYPATAFTFLVESFARVGCRVVRVGPSYADHMGLQWPSEDLPHIDMRLLREMIMWDLPNIVDWCTRIHGAPDLLFVGEENYQTRIIPEKRIPSVLWSADGWPENYRRTELWQPTLAYCNQPKGNALYPQEETPKPWRFLPGAAAPWLHKRISLDRNADFCLYATMYNNRPVLCKGLAEQGFSVLSGQKTNTEYVMGYNSALCTYHNPGWYEVKWRWFEAAAMGCINISDGCPLFHHMGYFPWEHYVPVTTEIVPEFGDNWPTTETLAKNITWLRTNQSRTREIADNAWRITLCQDTYYHRLQIIAEDLNSPELVMAAKRKIEITLAENKL